MFHIRHKKPEVINPCEAIIREMLTEREEDFPLEELVDTINPRYGKNYSRRTIIIYLEILMWKRLITNYRAEDRHVYIHWIRDDERKNVFQKFADKFLKKNNK